MKPWTKQFIELAIASEALRFGDFTLKSGRKSPYFFNAGQFNDGRTLALLADCYADAMAHAIEHEGLEFDLLFGPAYKGIPLAAVVAVSLMRRHGLNVPVAYNRKEAKAHGEGGMMVGAAIRGRVLILDDVLSGGTAFNECRPLIEQCGGSVVGLIVGLDRQERARHSALSASETIMATGAKVIAVAALEDLIEQLEQTMDGSQDQSEKLSAMLAFQSEYGVQPGPA
ncbi:MAG: orotate phosphoribosyltransferase [Pseudomonadota bacterium]